MKKFSYPRMNAKYDHVAAKMIYREHLDRICHSGIKWVRMEAEDVDAIKYACENCLNVIAIVKSRTALQNTDRACRNYCLCDWSGICREYIKEKMRELDGSGVKSWQVDNELNHPSS